MNSSLRASSAKTRSGTLQRLPGFVINHQVREHAGGYVDAAHQAGRHERNQRPGQPIAALGDGRSTLPRRLSLHPPVSWHPASHRFAARLMQQPFWLLPSVAGSCTGYLAR